MAAVFEAQRLAPVIALRRVGRAFLLPTFIVFTRSFADHLPASSRRTFNWTILSCFSITIAGNSLLKRPTPHWKTASWIQLVRT